MNSIAQENLIGEWNFESIRNEVDIEQKDLKPIGDIFILRGKQISKVFQI